MTDATRGTGESCLGQIWVLISLFVVSVAPLWVMLTAGLMQVFPDLMGLDVIVDDSGTRRAVTLYSVAVAGTLAGGLVGVFLGVLTVLGGTSWVVGRVQAALQRSDAKRFEALAGDAVMPGAELKTRTTPSDADDAT